MFSFNFFDVAIILFIMFALTGIFKILDVIVDRILDSIDLKIHNRRNKNVKY